MQRVRVVVGRLARLVDMSEKNKNYILIVDGRPQPKQRPRVTNTHTYTPADTVEAENRILAEWKAAFGGEKLEGDIELDCKFYYKDGRTADLDNLIKLVADGLGGGGDGFHPFNDRQVKKLHGYISTDADEDKQRTEITVREIEDD